MLSQKSFFNKSSLVLFLCFVSIIFSNCSKEKSPQQIIEVKEGIKYIINPTKPITNFPVEYYETKEELSIGVDAGDTNYVFGSPVIGDVDKDKNIFVYDNGFKRISKFDSSGRFCYSFGRKGQGPGEFGRISSIHVAKNGNIYVTDSGNRRGSIFDENGKFLNGFKLNYHERIIHETNSQKLLLKENITDYVNQTTHHHFTSYTLSGLLADTILTVNQEVFAIANRGGGASVTLHPFFYIFDSKDNFYIIFDNRYKIRKYGSKGILKTEFNRKYRSIALTKKEKQEYKGGTIGIGGKKYKPPAPDFKRDIHNIYFMPGDELWILTSQDNIKHGILFDVYDTQGNYIRKFFINTNLKKWKINFYGTKIYVSITNDEEFPRIKRFGLRKRAE